MLLVGCHVALLAAPHVEVRADRAGLESEPIHAVAPDLDELVVDVGVGPQHLGDVELDAGTEPVIGRGLDEGLGRVEPRGELGGERVEGDPELDPGAGDAVVFSHFCVPELVEVGGQPRTGCARWASRMRRASAASVIMREPAASAAERCTACSPAMMSKGLCQWFQCQPSYSLEIAPE